MFHFTPPLTADEHDLVADSKQVIYEGFRQALGEGVPTPYRLIARPSRIRSRRSPSVRQHVIVE
jgi:hypothetical protein